MKRLQFLLPRENTNRKFILIEAFYFLGSPMTVIFSVKSFSLWISPIFQTLTIMVLYQFCCPNRIQQYFRLFLSFLEMTIPSLSQPFCPYIPKQTQFAAMVGWLNSQKSSYVPGSAHFCSQDPIPSCRISHSRGVWWQSCSMMVNRIVA